MLTTLILASAMVTPATVAPVNFVHNFKAGTKLAYELKFGAEEMDFDMSMTVTIELGATKGGKTTVDIVAEMDDMGGAMGEMGGSDAFELVLDKNGLPLMDSVEDEQMMLVVALFTTYLPSTKLDVGGKFEYKRANDEVKISAKGKFTGMETVDKVSYAVLESESSITPADDDEAILTIKTYYNPKSQRVERTTAIIDTPDGLFNMSLKLKK